MQTMRATPSYALETRDILGVPVVAETADRVLTAIVERFEAGAVQRVAFLNANLAIRGGADAAELLRDFVVLNDGVAVDLAGWLLHGARFPDNLNGTDFTPSLLRRLPTGARVFLYGARPEVVSRTATLLASRGVAICGFCDGYGCAGSEAAEAARRARAEVILVALGNPLQEQWIREHGGASGARLLLAVGALFDFVSGAVVRAPRAVRHMRLEWLFRLTQEPKRLGGRYTLGIAQFFGCVLRERRRRRLGGKPHMV